MRIIVFLFCFSVCACATHTQLRPAERSALQAMFGGSNEPTLLDPTSTLGRACRGDAAALHQLFAKSLDPTLDGEYAETHSYDLDRALFELGDSSFAAAPEQEPQLT